MFKLFRSLHNGFIRPNIIEVIHLDSRNQINRFEGIRNQWGENGFTNTIKERFELQTLVIFNINNPLIANSLIKNIITSIQSILKLF